MPCQGQATCFLFTDNHIIVGIDNGCLLTFNYKESSDSIGFKYYEYEREDRKEEII